MDMHMDMDMDMVESHQWGPICFPQIDIFVHFFTGSLETMALLSLSLSQSTSIISIQDVFDSIS